MPNIKCFFIEPAFPDDKERSDDWRRTDTGDVASRDELMLIDGAMWFADWYLPAGFGIHAGPDGHVLVVRCPGGPWIVDSEASNCTRKGEPHACWVRHGDPRQPETVTVDKNGDTCAAGAGSIIIHHSGYHGFLRGGHLVSC